MKILGSGQAAGAYKPLGAVEISLLECKVCSDCDSVSACHVACIVDRNSLDVHTCAAHDIYWG